MRYEYFQLNNKSDEMICRGKTISLIKRNVTKLSIPVDLGSNGHYILLINNEGETRVSVREFYDRTGAGADEPKIQQQQFCSDLQAHRECCESRKFC